MSDSENEYLTTTRARRANAGGNLKKLLRMEETNQELEEEESAREKRAQIQQNIEENIDLLFQEEGPDEEFVASGSESSEGEENEEEEDEQAEEKQENDEMFSSDSEVSLSETDEDEGERELQAEAKLEKKKQQKRVKKVDFLVTKKPTSKPPKPKSTYPESSSLLDSSRRSSSRKTAIENKLAVAERLKESEDRRALLKPVFRNEVVAMTQEERLAEAVETEKQNVSSLQWFQEQEIWKKETQRAAMLSKKKPMVNFMTFSSAAELLYPNDEIAMTEMVARKKREEFLRLEKRKRRRVETKFVKSEDGVYHKVKVEDPVIDGEIIKEEKQPEEEEDYEGPPQKVARNYIFFETVKPLAKPDVAKYTFGDQIVSRKNFQTRPLARIKQQRPKIETAFTPYTETHKAQFEKMEGLPRFGDFDYSVDLFTTDYSEVKTHIELKTPAPISINLPNGQKKICLITGEKAQYFDPKNGVPYSSVDAYKVLKDVQDDKFQWAQIIDDDELGEKHWLKGNFKGGVGCYLNRWDSRPARGVPQGFE